MPDHFFSGSFGGKDTAKCFERENNSTFTLHKYLQYPFEKHWKHSEDLDDEVGVKLKAAYFYCLQSTHTHIHTQNGSEQRWLLFSFKKKLIPTWQ